MIDYLCIAAHQDDVEIMSVGIIGKCIKNKLKFGAVICTSGSGSSRTGEYANVTDEEMVVLRKLEQEEAANFGQYAFLRQLGYSSADVKTGNSQFVEDLKEVILEVRPRNILIHNIFDKHETHLSSAIAVLNVLRELKDEYTPNIVLGLEVWRDLDWLPNSVKYSIPVDVDDQFIIKMLNIFKSQVVGGKRYDLATVGRYHANATFSQSHATDETDKLCYGIDLTDIAKGDISFEDFVTKIHNQFKEDLINPVRKYGRIYSQK